VFHPEFAAIYTGWFVIQTNALPKLRHGAPSGVQRVLSRGSFLRFGIHIFFTTTQAAAMAHLLPISNGYN